MVGGRRKARSLALQALYEIDLAGHDPEAVLDRLLAATEMGPENAGFVRDLVRGVIQNMEMIDRSIARFAPAWPVEQLAIIDRNILRLAIFEVLLDNRAPVKVAIDEAVELAKAFGSDGSPKFINGVLGSVSTLLVKEKGSSKGG